MVTAILDLQGRKLARPSWYRTSVLGVGRGETSEKQVNRRQGLPFIEANSVHVALILKVTQSVGSGGRIHLWQGLPSLSFLFLQLLLLTHYSPTT